MLFRVIKEVLIILMEKKQIMIFCRVSHLAGTPLTHRPSAKVKKNLTVIKSHNAKHFLHSERVNRKKNAFWDCLQC